MLTNNWYNMFKAHFACSTTKTDGCPVFPTGDDTEYYGQAHASTAVYLFPGFQFSNAPVCTNLYSSGNQIAFGDGSTPPDKSDRTLSGSLITTLSSPSRIVHTSVEEGTLFTCVTMSLKNDGSDAVTIREVAWLGSMKTTWGSDTILVFDRTVLDSPVTIPAGGTDSITYKIGIAVPST